MTYASTKPIEELWLETIPLHWQSRKIKFLFSERIQNGFPNEPLLVASQSMGVVPKNVYGNRTVEATRNLHLLKLVEIGDFVISLRSFQGGIEYAYYRGIISPAYTVMIPHKEISPGYFRYLAKSKPFLELLKMCVTGIREGQNIDYAKLKNHLIPLPPREEQDQIVRFLDWKVSQINRLINARKKQVALLQEQKRAVINETVTKGGKGWEEKPLKYWVSSNNASLSAKTQADCFFDYLDISSVGHSYIKQKPIRYAFSEAPLRARRLVKYGDTIISTVRTYLRSVCFINHKYEQCVVSTGFSVLTPNKAAVVPELLSFVLSSDEFIDNVIRNSIGVSYPAISDSKLMTLNIALPSSLGEQEKIYNEIKNKITLFDDFVEKITSQLSLLHEYRIRLISDVVTGKMDVREIEIPQYEAVEEAIEVANDNTDKMELADE